MQAARQGRVRRPALQNVGAHAANSTAAGLADGESFTGFAM